MQAQHQLALEHLAEIEAEEDAGMEEEDVKDLDQ